MFTFTTGEYQCQCDTFKDDALKQLEVRIHNLEERPYTKSTTPPHNQRDTGATNPGCNNEAQHSCICICAHAPIALVMILWAVIMALWAFTQQKRNTAVLEVVTGNTYLNSQAGVDDYVDWVRADQLRLNLKSFTQ